MTWPAPAPTTPQLLRLDQELAARLERIIAGVDGHDEYDGLAGAYEGAEH